MNFESPEKQKNGTEGNVSISQEKTGLENVEQKQAVIEHKSSKFAEKIEMAQEKIKKIGGVDAAISKIQDYEKQKSGGKVFGSIGLTTLACAGVIGVSGLVAAPAVGGAIGIAGGLMLGKGAIDGIRGWWKSRELKKAVKEGHPDEVNKLQNVAY